MKKNLIGDIGGTHTRLVVFNEAIQWDDVKKYRNDDFSSLDEIITHFLQSISPKPTTAAFSIAGPVHQGEVTLTNRSWRISDKQLQATFNLDYCQVINDFSAVVMGIPALEPNNLIQIGGGSRVADAPIGVFGPGTGLGVGGLMPDALGGHIIVSEGGHATLPAADEQSGEIIRILRRRFGGHMSAERAISGPGLQNLYQAVADYQKVSVAKLTSQQIGEAAIAKSDPIAVQTLDYFFAWMGTVAGDLALIYGAKGGIYIAGNIVANYLPQLQDSRFRNNFESKGRLRSFMQAIPTYVILHPEVELLGLAKSINAHKQQQLWPYI